MIRRDRPGLPSGGFSGVASAQHQACILAAALWEHKSLAASEREQLHCQAEKCLGESCKTAKCSQGHFQEG